MKLFTYRNIDTIDSKHRVIKFHQSVKQCLSREFYLKENTNYRPQYLVPNHVKIVEYECVLLNEFALDDIVVVESVPNTGLAYSRFKIKKEFK